jgi:hypothetical protein
LRSEAVFFVPLLVAAVAVSVRLWSRWAYWGSGVGLAVALSGVWFGVANAGQALAAPLFVVVVPVAATFWVVSWERFARKPGWAFIAGLVVAVGAAFVGLVVGVNLDVIRP